MTRIFILVYLGVLAVLFAAWYIHGEVSKQKALADKARVFEEAHGGGARIVAEEINDTGGPIEDRLDAIRQRFDYPVRTMQIDQLPQAIQNRLGGGEDVAHYPGEGEGDMVVCSLAGGERVVVLGPFPDYRLQSIEEALGGWMRLTADKINAVDEAQRDEALQAMQRRFDFPIAVAAMKSLPEWPRARMRGGTDIVFYRDDAQTEELYLAVTPLANGRDVMRFGPFPSFEKIEQKAATTTLALVLLPAAIAIALLLRPVAWQLRRVENAARAIAAGDLTARVDERKVPAATALAEAFNQMAGRTESIVRTQRELVQAVSHELRTPLARMRFAIDLIETAADDEERKQRLESLDAATADLDELVAELLSYVKLETMEPQLAPEQIALRETLDTLLPKHAGIYPNIRFEVDPRIETAEQTLSADRRGFQRAIGNLLSNAGRHAASRVAVSAYDKDGFVTVDVDDDGPGIPEEDRQRVFNPFVRLGDAGSNGHGVGLGLALVMRIVTQHGGRVEVMPSPLGGCRIRTVWPCSDVG